MASQSNNKPSQKEAHSEQPSEGEARANIVFQPQKLTEVMEVINVMGSISEKISEQHDLAAGGAMTSSATGSSGTSVSARDQAIANLPSAQVMQKKLIAHIDAEVKALKKLAKEISVKRTTGWAYELTQVYARIRRLSALTHELLRASLEVLKRFYILVFIDGQAIVQGPAALRLA